MIKVILVEDHLVVRNGIRLLLDTSGEVEIISEAKDGSELMDLLNKGLQPDLVISDINMPLMDGLEVTSYLSANYPTIKVILLSMLNTVNQVIDAFDRGAKGYLVKNVGYNELIFAVKHVASGGRYVCEELTMLMLNILSSSSTTSVLKKETDLELDLSEREIEVLQLISEGYTNMEIADKLFLSKRTVEGHRQSLINKVKVKNSAELIKFAVQHHMVN
ncbi:response regulator [Sphingobacterium composti Ten et al. 2007 non Yoo et al. 2007]|uniref:response regulator n=1 Tax=Sphingobacterium composti TaxID=363260 RepID=UPI00135C5176|nr:response regulator transcription factor [Sphingobacterium composti Ten et al. 2007 non Yoo et al. 2007]